MDLSLIFFNADFNVSRVVDQQPSKQPPNESNVLAGEVDVLVEKPGSIRPRI